MVCFLNPVPNNVHVNFQNKSGEITVNFASLEGSATKYGVGCLTPSNASCWHEGVTSDIGSIVIDNLLPYTTYTIVVTTTAGGTGVFEKSVSQSYQVGTLEAGQCLCYFPPKGGWGFMMSPPCLECQGCLFDNTFLYIYLLSCSPA